MSNRLKLWSVNWAAKTAGPSPFENERTEIFLFGCDKAKNGDPCKGCFNTKLWDNSIAEKDYSPEEIANQIAEHAPNKFVTIGGGEPTDQMEGLIELAKLLKEKGFHIMMYTWKSMKDIFSNPEETQEKKDFRSLFSNIDMIVDGQFVSSKRLYQANKGDGLLNSVGSGNQIIWDIKSFRKVRWKIETPNIRGYALEDLNAISVDKKGKLKYSLLDTQKPAEIIHII